tara:strand:+ start:60 stop:437 length:378 start_codon:yes stop_codon:yes gene_type:complete
MIKTTSFQINPNKQIRISNRIDMSQLWVTMNMIENERKALHKVKNDPELYLFIREISGEKVDWDELSSRKRSDPEETFPEIDLDDWIEDEHERSKRLKKDIFVDRTMNGRMNSQREIRKRSIMDL